MSVIEILVAVFLVAVIGVAISRFQFDIFRVTNSVSSNLTAQDEARRALRRMIAEIRRATPSNTGSYPIAAAATSSVTFFSDIDGDLLKEQVRYYMSGTTLRKGVIKPTGSPLAYSGSEVLSTVVYNVRNSTSSPIFFYYDTNYDGTTASLSYPPNIASIRLIKVSLSIDSDILRPPTAMNVTTQISLRNLKDNL